MLLKKGGIENPNIPNQRHFRINNFSAYYDTYGLVRIDNRGVSQSTSLTIPSLDITQAMVDCGRHETPGFFFANEPYDSVLTIDESQRLSGFMQISGRHINTFLELTN